ncbi:hypothetical protein N473_06870 [Pseudoalteromonas luteoviolacea CPMOR-1]|uniref:Uncharacterized protein n=1 Tax=Pseudoalteromonas luteoviolacea CPMOR-1 TaxID=1365248 RepID=A0A162ART3_9GAMM|nr:hypothetical protein [Pseudoalteromonas luteoviolacea]KZN57599.1 hypothetical protein N473_06870 [Pseudoalteromonas luteoviolacea CPMOR-1]
MPTLEQSVAQLQQTNAQLVSASSELTGEVTNKMSAINSTVSTKLNEVDVTVQQQLSAAQSKYDAWLATKHVGFSMVDTLKDQTTTPITLPARFGTLAEAAAFQFSTASDYAPHAVDADGNVTHSYYTELYATLPGKAVYYSEPAPSQFTGRISVYMNVAVGDNAHPSNKPTGRIAVLINSLGAESQWTTVPHDFTTPRTLVNQISNMEIKGHSWSITNYDDLVAIAENVESPLSAGFSTVRIINLGPEPIHIKGLWIVHHGHNKGE